jgi:hypothetical protein
MNLTCHLLYLVASVIASQGDVNYSSCTTRDFPERYPLHITTRKFRCVSHLTSFEGQDNKNYVPVLRKMLPDFSLGMKNFEAWTLTVGVLAVSHFHSYALTLQGHWLAL